ncbi:MAG TPA: carbon-nitrogen hydrolase family protein [Pyrinomonadaceae bacterium]|nr:carbon-nitrogen hydrolase family protein [Pyrinomonadaceae bacterium]
MSKKVTVGIVQASPVFMNREASVAKAVSLIEEAAKKGAQLVAFGETWLAGYPAWLDYCPDAALWNHQPTKEVFVSLRQNSVVVPGRETEILSQTARENNIVLLLGINERIEKGAGNGTLYNSLLTFGSDGELLNHHRKLVPTFTERLVWGQGDAAGLMAVDTAMGRVGSLVCWEHWMPLTRQTLHISGEQIHISVYPTVHEMHQIASRHYAFEGRCFVLAAGLIMKAGDLPVELERCAGANDPNSLVLRGGSCIIAPDGSFVVEPVFDEETIITAELDLSMIDRELMTLDVSGHYHRPDVFEFKLRDGHRETRE